MAKTQKRNSNVEDWCLEIKNSLVQLATAFSGVPKKAGVSEQLMKYILIKIIELYQRTLSPDHGWFKSNYPAGYCKFTPSCSNYSKEAIIQKGAIRGSVLGVWRILRCNPWNKGGSDPVD